MSLFDFEATGEKADAFDFTPAEPKTAPTPVASKLNGLDVRILNYIEQVFWETGMVPTPEKIEEDLSIVKTRVKEAFKKEVFVQQLAVRGIDLGNEVHKKILNPQQLLLANMLLNLHDKRSVREKLELVKVSSQQYHAWMRQPQFVEFLRKRGEALFKNSDWEAYKGLTKAVSQGDINALKLFFEMRGIYNPRVQIDVNVEAVLTRVVEIVSKHVPSPEILEAIADELEGVVPQIGAKELTAG